MAEGWGLKRVRAAEYDTRLPTQIPGISFTGRGRIWYRRPPAARSKAVSVAIARAVALSEADDIARMIASTLPPDATFKAEQETAHRLADWRTSNRREDVEYKARLRFFLAPADAARATAFDESRRTARLDEALTMDHLSFLRNVVLGDAETAQLWWLHRNMLGDDPDTSWETFDKYISSLISHRNLQDDTATRLAKTLTTLIDKIHEEPKRLTTLTQVAAATFINMGWPELAAELTEQTAHPSRTPSSDQNLSSATPSEVREAESQQPP